MPGDSKTCVICGADVTDQPRIKDSKGRYACKPCAEKKARAAQAKKRGAQPGQKADRKTAPSAPAAGGAAMMEQWMAKSTEGQIALGDIEQPRCPNCEHPMMPDSVVCMGCGTHTKTGKKIRTQIKKADKEPKGGGGGIALDDPNTLSLVSLLAAIGLIAGTALTGELGVVFLLVAALWALIAGILMIVAAFQDGDTVWGIIGICQFVPFIGTLASLAFVFYYCTIGSTRTVRKISYWCAFIAIVGCAVALVFSNPELFAEA